MPPVTPKTRQRRNLRPFVYAGIATVLLLILALGVQEARSFEQSYSAERRRDLQDQLTQLVDDAEGRIEAERLRPLLVEMSTTETPADLAKLETERRTPLIDAIYVWDRDEMIFPPAAVDKDVGEMRRAPCMRPDIPSALAVPPEPGFAGTSALGAPPAPTTGAIPDPVVLAEGYRRCFASTDLNLRLFAASEAAELLLDAGQPAEADELLLRAPASTPLVQGARPEGVDARILVGVRLQEARAQAALGRSGRAADWIVALANEISSLDGPELERVMDFAEFPIPQDLAVYRPGMGLPADVEETLERARRRLAAWHELQGDSIGGPETPLLGEYPLVNFDPLDDPPWVVLVSRLGVGELTGAIQIDQVELARDILGHAKSRFARYLTIRDSAGRVVAGSSEDVAVDVALPHLLPNLHVGFTMSVIPTGQQRRSAFVLRLAPFGMAIAIGVVALLALVRTDRQQDLLLQRQRDFVARVSHELKTPLAGIRVMAENLEIGAFRDDAQREAFARRIVQEAERLTERVNEVIKAATRPEDDVAVSADVDALLTDLVASWRPRYDAARMQLFVEVQPIGTLTLMPVLLRDALTNLLDNALKYRKSEGGGRVWLRAHAAGRFVYFEVEDDGLGVPTEQRRSIFERFRRVEGAGRGKAGGHGLGLAFVAETARLHGGKVECVDGTGGGAKFILKIRRRS